MFAAVSKPGTAELLFAIATVLIGISAVIAWVLTPVDRRFFLLLSAGMACIAAGLFLS